MIQDNTQTKAILEHLLSGKAITSIEAIELYGATRLSGIIYYLREQGYQINSSRKVIKTRYGKSVAVAVYSFERQEGATE